MASAGRSRPLQTLQEAEKVEAGLLSQPPTRLPPRPSAALGSRHTHSKDLSPPAGAGPLASLIHRVPWASGPFRPKGTRVSGWLFVLKWRPTEPTLHQVWPTDWEVEGGPTGTWRHCLVVQITPNNRSSGFRQEQPIILDKVTAWVRSTARSPTWSPSISGCLPEGRVPGTEGGL